MNIILEGTDGVGKSTFAEIFRGRYDVIHNGQSPLKDFNDIQHQQELHNEYLLHLANTINMTIFDRFIYSEYVYGGMFRNRNSGDYLLDCCEENRWELNRNNIVIFIYADPKLIRNQFDIGQNHQIQERYKKIFKEVNCVNKVEYHNSFDDPKFTSLMEVLK